MPGVQTTMSSTSQRAGATMASKVLKLNWIVPRNWAKVLIQPEIRGR